MAGKVNRIVLDLLRQMTTELLTVEGFPQFSMFYLPTGEVDFPHVLIRPIELAPQTPRMGGSVSAVWQITFWIHCINAEMHNTFRICDKIEDAFNFKTVLGAEFQHEILFPSASFPYDEDNQALRLVLTYTVLSNPKVC